MTRTIRASDVWFVRQVECAIREADDPTVERISDDGVKSTWSKRRAVIAGAIDRTRPVE